MFTKCSLTPVKDGPPVHPVLGVAAVELLVAAHVRFSGGAGHIGFLKGIVNFVDELGVAGAPEHVGGAGVAFAVAHGAVLELEVQLLPGVRLETNLP